MRQIFVKIIPVQNGYQLVIQRGWINKGKPFGLLLSNDELVPLDEEFAPLVPLIVPYLPEIKRVIESGEYVPNKRTDIPIQTDGWVK